MTNYQYDAANGLRIKTNANGMKKTFTTPVALPLNMLMMPTTRLPESTFSISDTSLSVIINGQGHNPSPCPAVAKESSSMTP